MDNTLNLAYMNNNWFDIEYKSEREELADLEYQDPLITLADDLEFLTEPKECTCEIDEDTCEVHNTEIKEDEDE